MKHNIFSIFVPALLTAGLLASCSKINERLDGLDKRLDGLESERIATIDSQIENIKGSIADLGIIRDNIRTLTSTAEAQGEDVTVLKAADEALGQRVETLKTFVKDTLDKYSKAEWTNATFATLDQYRATCNAIAKVDAALKSANEKLSKEIKECAESLTVWINTKFGEYYTIAELDARLENMQVQIESAAAVSEARADSIAAELTKAKSDISSMITDVTAEYKAIIDSAIIANEGKLTKALNDKLQAVEERITPLNKRVADLEGTVNALYGRTSALESMIQSIAILSDYSDGRVCVDGDTLVLECAIEPAFIISRLTPGNFKILLKSVKTKAVDGFEVLPADSIKVFSPCPQNGTVSIKANIAGYIETAVKQLKVAVKVSFKHNINFTSSSTTDFVTAYFPMRPPMMKLALAGPDGSQRWTWNVDGEHFIQGNASHTGIGTDFGKIVPCPPVAWWGVSDPTDLLGQIGRTKDGTASGAESSDAYMVFKDNGEVTSYDKDNNEIATGTYEIQKYNPERNNGWDYGKLVVSNPLCILFPWGNGTPDGVSEYDITYLDGNNMTLVYPGNSAPGSPDEVWFWRFKSFSPEIALSSLNGSRKWKWDYDAPNGFTCWGNGGASSGDGYNSARTVDGQWWGVYTPENLLDQLGHAKDNVATGGESSDAYMVFTSNGEVTSYKGDGTVITTGKYEILDKNPKRNDNWELGKLKVSDPLCILFPWSINEEGKSVDEYDLMYIDENFMTLVYTKGNSPGSWGEITHWMFKSE